MFGFMNPERVSAGFHHFGLKHLANRFLAEEQKKQMARRRNIFPPAKGFTALKIKSTLDLTYLFRESFLQVI